MNINDVAGPNEIPDSFVGMIRAIFFKQAELMTKYKDIEQLPSAPVSLHTAAGQRVIKDFAWRTVEELTESAEAWEKHEDDPEVARSHALEELADAVHFFIELCIFAGITPDQCAERRAFVTMTGFHPDDGVVTSAYWDFTKQLGIAMNFLRNKAWKQSQVPTDEGRFRAAVVLAFSELMSLWGILGCTYEDIYMYYMRKHAVNKFRQRSNY